MPSLTERMWQDYHARLRGFILKRVADPSCADDILQDVFDEVDSSLRGDFTFTAGAERRIRQIFPLEPVE